MLLVQLVQLVQCPLSTRVRFLGSVTGIECLRCSQVLQQLGVSILDKDSDDCKAGAVTAGKGGWRGGRACGEGDTAPAGGNLPNMAPS